jgi:alcohol dehydrogenase class IV
MDRILRVEQLCASLQVPSLASYGMMMADLPILIEKVPVGSSMQRNAIQLPREEMWEILAQAL